MYIGNDNIYGTRELFRVDSESGKTTHLPVMSKDEGFIGTLHLAEGSKNEAGYLEWCKGTLNEGSGIKIELSELIDFLDSKATQD